MIKISDTELNSDKSMASHGLFNLKEFIGWSEDSVIKYFKNKGWELQEVFNDYRLVMTKKEISMMIICCLECVAEEYVTAIGSIECFYTNDN